MNTEYTVELIKSKDEQHSLVLWKHPSGKQEFVICSYYDGLKPVGSQWHWGHYFDNLQSAMDSWNEEKY